MDRQESESLNSEVENVERSDRDTDKWSSDDDYRVRVMKNLRVNVSQKVAEKRMDQRSY